MGIVLAVITGLIYLKRQYFSLPVSIAAFAFFTSASVFPVVLKPVYVAWMRLAFVLSWINTRLILCLIFYLVFTPIGLAIKLCGRDLLDRKFEKRKVSYWKTKDAAAFNPLDYARQF